MTETPKRKPMAPSEVKGFAIGWCKFKVWKEPAGPEHDRLAGILEKLECEFEVAADEEGLSKKRREQLLRWSQMAFEDSKRNFEGLN